MFYHRSFFVRFWEKPRARGAHIQSHVVTVDESIDALLKKAAIEKARAKSRERNVDVRNAEVTVEPSMPFDLANMGPSQLHSDETPIDVVLRETGLYGCFHIVISGFWQWDQEIGPKRVVRLQLQIGESKYRGIPVLIASARTLDTPADVTDTHTSYLETTDPEILRAWLKRMDFRPCS